MIEFEEIQSPIPPENTQTLLPKKEDVKLFFDSHFKKNFEEYLVYKKNQFNNPNKEILKDFVSKFENFIKQENKKDENNQIINLIFQNISNNIKLLEEQKCLPDNDKIMAFLTSFTISKFFS
jgi:hypothetical protein